MREYTAYDLDGHVDEARLDFDCKYKYLLLQKDRTFWDHKHH